MKNLLKKPIVFFPALVLLLVASISAHKSLFPSATLLTSEGKFYSVQFQSFRGSNRIGEFKKLCSAVFGVAEQAIKSTTLSTTKYNNDDIEKMLGKADAVLPNGAWIYYLNPSQETCKAIIYLDTTTQTIYCTITDCD